MKLPCATFSDTRHVVQTTKLSFPTRSTTENWTSESWHFIYRLQWNFHVRPSRIRDMLFKLLNLVFLPEVLLKTGPPNLGILCTDYNETSLATFSDTPHTVQTTKLSFATRSTTENWTTKSWHFIYRLQWNLHVRPSRIHDILFKLLNLVLLLEVLLKTGPPNLGILYTDYSETSMCDLLGYATCCSNY